ncbi:hypothetical protein ACOSQ2_021880 [Xanthoceras sorbifolium]
MENTTNSIILANACYSLGISATVYISFFSTLVFIEPYIQHIAITFKSRFQVNENLKKCSLPPGPKPWLIVGSLPEMLRNKPTFWWLHELMNDMNTEIACIRLGCIHVIAVSCPARHRLFHATRIEEADHLIRYVHNQCKNNYEDGGLVNVRVASQQYCGNVIRKMVFNKRFFGKGMADGGPGLEEVEHVHALFTVLQYLNSFCVTDYVSFWRWKLDLDGHEKVMKKAIGIIEKYHDPLIEERVRQWRDGLKKDVEDVLDILITLKDGNGNPLLSTKEVTAQITEIMIAAVDNPSNAVEWALAEMMNQPEILQKAIEEVDRVVGKERLVQESDFSQLNCIKACAREGFRLHPIAPFNVLLANPKGGLHGRADGINRQEAASGPDRNVALSTVDPSPMVIEEDHHLEPSNKPNKPRWKRLARNKGKFSNNSRGDKARSKSGRESVNWGWWLCEEI